MRTLTLTRPDDWHLHLRDGAALAAVLPDTAARFRRAIVMPNLKPPVVTTADALAYRERIVQALHHGPARRARFEPLMTLYLTDNTPPEEIDRARASGAVHGVKLYPAGATTNSDSGVTSIERCFRTLERMQALRMPLLVHGEVTDPEVDVFDRERAFVERVLVPLIAGPDVAATITAHHLLLNRNAIFAGGVRPHHYCLPVLKRETHRRALVRAAISGNPKFFLGTDSAPHARHTKEAACGCAGCYTAHAGIELYAEAFDQAGALDRLEGFASWNGPDFYGLPRNSETITLVQEPWRVPDHQPFDHRDVLVPLRAGEQVQWKLKPE